MCNPSVSSKTTTFNATSSSLGVVLWTPWTLAVGTNNLRIVRNIEGSSGSPTTNTVYQFAKVKTTEPDPWTSVNSNQTGDGYKTDNVDISATTDKMWVRAGLEASAATQAQGQATLTLMTDTEAKIVGQKTIVMVPTPGTTFTTVPLAPPLPMVGMSKVLFIAIYSHEGGTTTIRTGYRKIANNLDAGGSWVTITAPPALSVDANYSSGEQTLADDTSQGYWQPGFSYKNTTYGGLLKVLVVAVW